MNRQLEREDIERTVAEFEAVQPWNHNYVLLGGVETRPGAQQSQGKNLVKLDRIRPLLKTIGLSGKRVLDVGCNEGFFAFYCASEGAEVLGIDIDPHRIAKAEFVQSVSGEAHVRFRVLDIYSTEFACLEPFDLCLCLGVLHRIPDPFRALAAMGGKAELLLLEWKALKFGPHDDAFAYFSPKDVDKHDFYGTEYWLLSYATVERVLLRLGFSRFHRIDDPRQHRALLVAGKTDHPIFHQPDLILHRGRLRAFLSHTKRYLRTVVGILAGRVNA
jgi:SAM-dependent methyltransferase